MKRDWIQATKGEPCAVCGSKGWCERSADGEVIVCMKGDGSAFEGVTPESRTNKAGSRMFVYRLSSSGSCVAVPSVGSSSHKGDADQTNRAYSRLIVECQRLSMRGARKHLIARGLDVDVCEAIIGQGFCELPARGRYEIAKRIVDHGLERDISVTPGFAIFERDGRQYWSITGYSGFLIPVRDLMGRVIGMQVRISDDVRAKMEDSPPKYVWLSSRSRGGSSPGSPCHVPQFDGDRSTVRITEGILKAEAATRLGSILTIGVAGTAIDGVDDIVREIEPREVRLAFDPEYAVNSHIFGAVENLIELFEGMPFDLAVEVWDLACGKGIDDLLISGKQPEVISPAEFVKRYGGKAAAAARRASEPKRDRIQNTALSVIQQSDTQPKLFSTGIHRLDLSLGGGIEHGERIVIGGRPGNGKSALGQHILSALAAQEQRCWFLSCEMTRRQVGKRAVMRATAIPSDTWQSRHSDVAEDVMAEYAANSNYGVTWGVTLLDDVVKEIRDLAKTEKLDCVLIDYLQLISASKSANEFEQVRVTSRTLTQLGSDLGLTMIMLAQVGRQAEKRPGRQRDQADSEYDLMPQLSDLKGSGQIEQDADSVVFGVLPCKYDASYRKSLYVLKVAKCRNRDSDPHPFTVDFAGERMRFIDITSPTCSDADVEWVERQQTLESF